MKRHNSIHRTIALCLAMCMLLISVPGRSAWAGMVSTEQLMSSEKAHQAREYIHYVLAQEDVRQKLLEQGIDPVEAQSRIDTLSHSEVIALAEHIQTLPAGGSTIGIVIGTVAIIFIVLLATDILGYTDVFPFVIKKKQKE